MSALLSDPVSTPPATLRDSLAPEAAGPVEQRLAHLFRGSLKAGRIHPLYLPMLRYRQARNDHRG